MSTRQEREKINREWLKTHVDQHLNKLILELLHQKPDNVLEFIYKWALEHSGSGDTAPVTKSQPKPKQETVQAPQVEESPADNMDQPVETVDMSNVPKEDKGDYKAPDLESDEDEEGDDVPDMEQMAIMAITIY